MSFNTSLCILIATIIFFLSSCKPTSDDQKLHDMSKTEVNENPQKNNPPVETDKQELIDLGIDVEKGIPTGLKVGDKAPMINEKDLDGNDVNLDVLLESGPVVLQFYRGQWCPVCSRYASAFQDSVDLILDRGAHIFAISPETAENATKYLDKTQLKYPIISDNDLSIMDDYKVTFFVTDDYVAGIEKHLKSNIPENNGSPEAKLPVPATYVIDQDGKIGFVQFDYNYKNRAQVADILKHI